MCHGTFDVVHPGHVRHLLYAKSKARHPDRQPHRATRTSARRNFRPFVPQDLRAMNLAALEMVDYVVIDRDADAAREHRASSSPTTSPRATSTPTDGLHPQDRRRRSDVLEAYGGEMIFTPGDIVYSSSSLIETDAADDRDREAAWR